MPSLRPLQGTGRRAGRAGRSTILALAARLPGLRRAAAAPGVGSSPRSRSASSAHAGRHSSMAEFALLAGPLVAVALTRLARTVSPARFPPARVGSARPRSPPRSSRSRWPAARRRHGEAVFDLGVEEDLVPTAALRCIGGTGCAEGACTTISRWARTSWQGWPRHRYVFQDPHQRLPRAMHAVLLPIRLASGRRSSTFGVTSALVSTIDLNPRAAWFPLSRPAGRSSTARAVSRARAPPSRSGRP